MFDTHSQVRNNIFSTHFLSFHAEQKVETQHDVAEYAASEEGKKGLYDTEGEKKVEAQHDVSKNAASGGGEKESCDTEGWHSSSCLFTWFHLA